MTVYMLWEGSNAIGGFESEEDALAVVRESVEQFGPEDIGDLTLWSISTDRHLRLLADSEELHRRIALP